MNHLVYTYKFVKNKTDATHDTFVTRNVQEFPHSQSVGSNSSEFEQWFMLSVMHPKNSEECTWWVSEHYLVSFLIRFSSCFRPNPSSAMTHMTGAHFCYFRTMPGTRTFSCANPRLVETWSNKVRAAVPLPNHRQGQRMRSSAFAVLSSHLDRVWATTAPEPTTCAFMFGPGRDSRLSFTDDRIVVVSNNSDGISSREDSPGLSLLAVFTSRKREL